MTAPRVSTVVTSDAQSISVTRFDSPGEPKAIVVIAGATAVPQQFYRRFANSMNARGYSVVTFDYRGIGGSAPASLVGYEMNFLDWGRRDLAAVLGAVTRPGLPVLMVGHSYGGHALGLLPQGCRVDGLYAFGTGAGWHGYMKPLERVKVQLLWSVVAPVLTAWKGYLPFKLLGMGEDLPIGVYRQWRHWCSFPRYFFDDPLAQNELSGFARATAPIFAANATDDAWAPPRSRDAFMAGYHNAHVETRDLLPAAYGLKRIGHIGYFRSEASALWAEVADWFDARIDSLRPAAVEQVAR